MKAYYTILKFKQFSLEFRFWVQKEKQTFVELFPTSPSLMVFNVMCFVLLKSHTVQISLSIPIARIYLLKKRKEKKLDSKHMVNIFGGFWSVSNLSNKTRKNKTIWTAFQNTIWFIALKKIWMPWDKVLPVKNMCAKKKKKKNVCYTWLCKAKSFNYLACIWGDLPEKCTGPLVVIRKFPWKFLKDVSLR